MIEHSRVHRRNAVILTVSATFVMGMAGLTFYLWLAKHYLNLFELVMEFTLIFWLIKRATVKYTYEAGKRELKLTGKGLLGGGREIAIPYRDILGVYRHEPKLLSILKFRRSFRFHSALDGTPVYAVAYAATGWGNRLEHRRAFFKPSEEMLDFLALKLPDKVRVSENEVFASQVAREK